jgi:hypothetical protein
VAAVRPDEQWLRDITEVVFSVQFDQQPIDGLDRLLELIIATDTLPGSPERYLAAARAALDSRVRLADLVPQPHSEGAIRKLLTALADRLEQWIEQPIALTQLPVTAWRPGPAADPVAHLDREVPFLERWLGVQFEHVADPVGEVRIAVLGLPSGSTVALVQVAGNPVPGTSLLRPGTEPRPRREVLDEFLRETRLTSTVVGSAASGIAS